MSSKIESAIASQTTNRRLVILAQLPAVVLVPEEVPEVWRRRPAAVRTRTHGDGLSHPCTMSIGHYLQGSRISGGRFGVSRESDIAPLGQPG
jgi:hypothetical protein